MSELSEFFIKKAKDELGEDEFRRVQSIQLFREWLKKHPFIKFQEIDDIQILKYVRAKKYSMSKAFKSCEKMCCFMKQNPEFFINTEDEFKKCIQLLEMGLGAVMNKHDDSGATIIIYNLRKFEESNVNMDVFVKLQAAVNLALEHEDETQIGGVIIIYDFRETSLNYVTQFPVNKLYEVSEMSEYIPLRMKATYLIGLPSFFMTISNATLKLFSTKHQHRLMLIKDEIELHKYIDKSILIEEYGGDLKNSDCIVSLKRIMEKNMSKVISFDLKYQVDFSKVKEFEDESESVGSFRKLEVD